MIQSIFSSWALAPTHCTIVDSSIYFLSLLKSAFLVTKALLCLYDKQNNTWSLVDKKFPSECSTRHFISTRAHAFFSKNSARLCIHNMTCAVSLRLKVLSSLAARIQNYQLRLFFRSIPIEIDLCSSKWKQNMLNKTGFEKQWAFLLLFKRRN